MKHSSNKRTLGRTTDQRTALLRSLASSLVIHGKIKTTEARAKELRPFVEKLVTHARVGSVASRRLVLARLGNIEGATKKLVSEVAPRYKERKGGYTRITKLPPRMSDGSKMAIIEFV